MNKQRSYGNEKVSISRSRHPERRAKWHARVFFEVELTCQDVSQYAVVKHSCDYM